MRSSTSNSNSRLPELDYRALWLMAIAVSLVLLGGLEGLWRSHGWRPAPEDSPELWSIHRDGVYEDNALVLLGASHMMCDVSPAVISRRLPNYEVCNLSRNGEAPVAALRDLAEDEEFSGVAVIDLDSFFFEKSAWESQQGAVEFYHRWFSLNRKFNCLVASWLGSRLVVLNPELGLSPTGNFLVPLIRDRRFPLQPKLFSSDRSLLIDFGKVENLEGVREERLADFQDVLKEGTSSPEVWLGYAEEIAGMVSRIQDRGGEVVVVHFPLSGEYNELAARVYPREEYWDVLAARNAFPMIHFEDRPDMAELTCPDFSHLDREDAIHMSEALVDALVELGVVEAGNGD